MTTAGTFLFMAWIFCVGAVGCGGEALDPECAPSSACWACPDGLKPPSSLGVAWSQDAGLWCPVAVCQGGEVDLDGVLRCGQ
jgi:hypothetical protein